MDLYQYLLIHIDGKFTVSMSKVMTSSFSTRSLKTLLSLSVIGVVSEEERASNGSNGYPTVYNGRVEV